MRAFISIAAGLGAQGPPGKMGPAGLKGEKGNSGLPGEVEHRKKT